MTTGDEAAAGGSFLGASGFRRCDYCEEQRALVYCRADSARLCLACDRHVHSANGVSSKHHRSLICDACLSAPSSILLFSSQRHQGGHPRLLCANCDFDARDGRCDDGEAGERRAVEAYSGCPEAVEMLALLGVSSESEKSLFLDGSLDECSSFLLEGEVWLWDTPPILKMEDIIVPINLCQDIQALNVPPPPKGRSAACGKHKDEILRQLRKLVRSDISLSGDFGVLEAEMQFRCQQEAQTEDMIRSIQNGDAPVVVPPSPVMILPSNSNGINCLPAFSSEKQLETFIEESEVFLGVQADVPGSVSDGNSKHLTFDVPSSSAKRGCRYLGLDRDTVLSRYKEKRKTRRFDRHIRYVSRKVRADGRLRIKGRFAKTK